MIRKTSALRVLAAVTIALMVATAGAGSVAAVPDPPHEVFGTVTDQKGNAVSGVSVTVSDTDGDSITATTNSDGYYEIKFPAEDADDGETLTVKVEGAEETTAFSSGTSERIDFDGVEEPPTDNPVDDGDSDVENGGATVDLSDGDGSTGSVTVSGLPAGASTVTVYEANAPTGGAPAPSNNVAVYLDIAADVDVSNDVTVSVTVDASALEDAGIATDDAVLLHYTDGSWSELGTDVTTDGEDVTLDATASGLSPFAVAQADDDDDSTGGGNTGGGQTGGDDGDTDDTPTATPDDGTPDDGSTPDDGTPDDGTPDDGAPVDGTPDDGTTDVTSPEPDDDGPGPLLIGGLVIVVLAIAGAAYVVYGREQA
ncbi:carboxypeptidase-like regulatory domain-containing protein [Halorarum salinum]|uniref:PGF-pre-PGF domain-containing protein n=1 Tax=Halorarum salinum TaxID=2743089 RepID=A0A7D5L999_9EURY|nr:carboxypeptidase-like regulatory domain-containing protein [Halobaculum salinum]QLG61346.1 PGF-pre-PGF domain-containing protein [Halobaculum salinum]